MSRHQSTDIKNNPGKLNVNGDISAKGFSLMEVIFAIFIVVVAVSATFTVVRGILAYNSTNADRLIAAYLAQEGIEIIRNVRDGNWLEQRANPSNLWDEGIGAGSQCITANGCAADYRHSYPVGTDEDPSLPAYNDNEFLKIDSNGFYSYDNPGTPSRFKRKINVTVAGPPDELQVSVIVSWLERGRPYNVSVQERLFNWK